MIPCGSKVVINRVGQGDAFECLNFFLEKKIGELVSSDASRKNKEFLEAYIHFQDFPESMDEANKLIYDEKYYSPNVCDKLRILFKEHLDLGFVYFINIDLSIQKNSKRRL